MANRTLKIDYAPFTGVQFYLYEYHEDCGATTFSVFLRGEELEDFFEQVDRAKAMFQMHQPKDTQEVEDGARTL